MNKLIGLISVIGLSFLMSCSDDDDATPTKTQLLSNKWVLTASLVNDGDVFTTAPACFKDDTYTFFASGEFVQDSKTKCDNESDEIEATWTFQDNETVLVISGNSSSAGSYTITKLTATELSGYRTIQVGGQNARNDVTFAPM